MHTQGKVQLKRNLTSAAARYFSEMLNVSIPAEFGFCFNILLLLGVNAQPNCMLPWQFSLWSYFPSSTIFHSTLHSYYRV